MHTFFHIIAMGCFGARLNRTGNIWAHNSLTIHSIKALNFSQINLGGETKCFILIALLYKRHLPSLLDPKEQRLSSSCICHFHLPQKESERF